MCLTRTSYGLRPSWTYRYLLIDIKDNLISIATSDFWSQLSIIIFKKINILFDNLKCFQNGPSRPLFRLFSFFSNNFLTCRNDLVLNQIYEEKANILAATSPPQWSKILNVWGKSKIEILERFEWTIELLLIIGRRFKILNAFHTLNRQQQQQQPHHQQQQRQLNQHHQHQEMQHQ